MKKPWRNRHQRPRRIVLAFLLLLVGTLVHSLPTTAQSPESNDPTVDSLLFEPMAEPGFGYTYTNLLTDLVRWAGDPNIRIDSIGHTVENRTIWELTITDPTAPGPRRRVYIHARTHPNEVQAFHVAESMINYLTSDAPYARTLRERLIIHIVPMANPDGVELLYGRENSNGIDLERDWDKSPMQPESGALKQRFTALMDSPSPILVAINMHSATACRRYFVYHDETGTSMEYAVKEQRFIDGVRTFWPSGIEPWNYNRTWVNETPTHFPESWWWGRLGATIMALTYEDMNCPGAGNYDSTAMAILGGIGSWLSVPASVRLPGSRVIAGGFNLRALPNPSWGSTTVHYSLPARSEVAITVTNVVGETIETVTYPNQSPGDYQFTWTSREATAGNYFLTVGAGEYRETIRLVVGMRGDE